MKFSFFRPIRLSGRTRSRSVAAGTIFVLWCGGVAGVLGAMGRQVCALPGESNGISRERNTVAAGWKIRHWLPADHPLTAKIVAQLAARGPQSGEGDEIFLTDPNGVFGDSLRRAGWQVLACEPIAEPGMEIISPQQKVQWRGRFRADDFQVKGAVMLDTAVLVRVARGESLPPIVPIGCGVN